MKEYFHNFKKHWDAFIIKITDIVFFPVAFIVNSVVLMMSSERQNKVNKLFHRLTSPGIRFISLVMLIVMVSSIIFTVYYQISPPKNSNLAGDAPGLPYQEKIADGVWALKNREPLHQVLAEGPTPEDLALQENKQISKDPNKQMFRWSTTLESGTRFEFGLVDSNTPQGKVMPVVNITNKEGWFVRYKPSIEYTVESIKDKDAVYGIQNTKYSFVTPKVEKNVISWEISEGITARYTMQADRVKADYIVKDQKSINNNQLDFDFEVSEGSELQKMPSGEIALINSKTLTEIFTIPVPEVIESGQASQESWNGEFSLEELNDTNYSLSIILPEGKLADANFPLTIDPQVIDSSVGSDATEYAISRLLQKDAWGNLIAIFKETGSSASTDDVWYKNYNSTTWTDAGIDIDGSGSTDTEGLSVDIDSSGNIHAAVTIDTWSLIYRKITLTRNSNNLITGTAVSSSLTLDSSGVAREHVSIIIANKGGGAGIEKVVVSYNSNTATGGSRGEIRFMQCDVADNCTTAANWKNASEEKNGSGTCADTGTGNVGLPNASTCKGTADALFAYTSAHTRHHAVLTQMPYVPKRSPTSVKKFQSSTYTDLSNAIDNNTGTTADLSNLSSSGEYIYIGDDKPFSKITFDVTNPNSSDFSTIYTNIDYWNGASWLWTGTVGPTPVDNTENASCGGFGCTLTEDGSVLFDPPSNWTQTTVDGVSKYWIRIDTSITFDSDVTVAEITVNERNSGALMVVGGVDATVDLRAAYIPWDDVTGDRWDNNPSVTGNGWRADAGGASSALDNFGANYSDTDNYPLTATIDYKNNRAYVAYHDCETISTACDAVSLLEIKTIPNNKDITVAANWSDTSFPAVTEGTDLAMSLTSDGSDIYLFYVLDPGTNSLVFRRCSGSGGGLGGVCDNASDWGSEKTLYNDTTVSHPQAVVTKVTGDTVAIDTIFTDTTDSDVLYERHYVDLADKTVVVAASGDDAFHRDCISGTDDQDIAGSTVILGREENDPSCVSTVDSNNHVGLRFPSINVAQGTKISSAYIDVRVNYPCDIVASRYNADDTSVFAKLKNIIVSPAYAVPGVCNGNTSFTIYGEDVDDSASFSTLTNCTDPCSGAVDERTKTTSSASYSIRFDTITYRLDVTDIIQEIVCRGASSSQPCVGDFNGSGAWVSGNDLAILIQSTDGNGSDLRADIVAQDDGSTQMLDPTLQINVAPSGTTGKKYSMGSGTQLPTGSGSVADLDHPFSSLEFNSVTGDDTNYASVSATTNYASASAQPSFMFKVNNSNNNNTYKIDASAVLRSSLASSNKPIYLQVYRGGSTDNWVTVDTDSTTAADTDITLSATVNSNLSEYYFNETPGIGTQYAECTDGTANCWSYWRIYQDAPGTNQNINLALDFVDISFSESGAEETPRIKGGTRLRGGTRIR